MGTDRSKFTCRGKFTGWLEHLRANVTEQRSCEVTAFERTQGKMIPLGCSMYVVLKVQTFKWMWLVIVTFLYKIGDWSNGMIGVSKTFGGSSILSSPAFWSAESLDFTGVQRFVFLQILKPSQIGINPCIQRMFWKVPLLLQSIFCEILNFCKSDLKKRAVIKTAHAY